MNRFICKTACVLFLFSKCFVLCQSISKPTFQYSGICARPALTPSGQPFDSFLVDFNITSLNLFAAGNKFFLEISDATGSFSNPTIVVQPTIITQSPANLNFIVPPTFVGGENFRFRVKSTNPTLTSPVSDFIYAYYRPFNIPFSLNNGTPTAIICDNSGVLLKVDNPAAGFSNLIYKWFKNNNLIIGATANTYLAMSAGSYYTEIDYGSCPNGGLPLNSKPDIIVNVSTGGQNIIISSTNGNVVSSSTSVTITSSPSQAGYSYQWYLDNNIILGEVSANITTNIAGSYYLLVNNGNCSVTSNSILLTQFVKPTTSNTSLIPNLVSPNGDSFNDTWSIPAEYTENTGTNITILDKNGKTVFYTTNYLNNWPLDLSEFSEFANVFYYIIAPKDGNVLKGTITIVR